MVKTSNASNIRINRKNCLRNQSDPFKTLTNEHLNELWICAARLGENRVCEQIEEVRFERLEREREKYYEKICN